MTDNQIDNSKYNSITSITALEQERRIIDPQTMSYKLLLESYKEWLETIGYSKSTIYNNPIYLKEFLCYLEAHQIYNIEAVPDHLTVGYSLYLQRRKNKRRGGTLSNSSINARLSAVELLSQYLLKERETLLAVTAKKLPKQNKAKSILTMEEVANIYQFLEGGYLGIRDKAMLGLLYGCGLRSNEVVTLNLEDVRLEREILHIKKAKNRYERLVPITANIRYDLEQYLIYGRPYLTRKQPHQSSFLVGYRGHRIDNGGMNHRLRRLLKITGISTYKTNVSLHSLRHSIATHLLQKGMPLDDIRQFLGHRSLESTQIYTHIVHEIQ